MFEKKEERVHGAFEKDLKRKRNVFMELLRRMAYGGMFGCLILLLFHGIHIGYGMMPSFGSFGMELNGLAFVKAPVPLVM
jgi:hypothetical protein